MKDKEKQIEFKVIDNNTGKEADIGKIALKEDWAKGLMYCDMQGFAILDDGNLVLLDECGKFEYCPSERFSIKFENSVVLSREEYENYCNLSVENEVLKEEKEQFENDVCNYEMNLQHLTGELEQVRKETAEKYHKAMRKIIHERDYIGGYAEIGLQEENDEIAEQFDVEIKE